MSKKRKQPKKDAQHQRDRSDSPGREPSGESWFRTHGRDLKFILVFGSFLTAYYIFSTTDIMSQRFFPWYLELNASASGWLLQNIGFDDVTVRGKTIRSTTSAGITVERGCDAIEPAAMFIAAVLGSPVLFRRKIPAIILGTLFLLLLNLVRLASLFLTGIYLRSLFDLMHLNVWQAAFIIVALMLWALWAARESRLRKRHAHART